MATTINQGFDQLRRNLEITNLQTEVVSTRQQNVREAVEKEMTVLDSFLTGSYRRNTMIAPLADADVDIIVVMHPSYYQVDGQASLLDRVKRVLKKTYPLTPEISRDGQAVTIRFSDFKVDVVPSFYRKGGGFLIPDSISSQWISTDPNKHVEIWSTANQAHKGALVPLIKMIKGWNKNHSQLFRCFHLESLILKILENVEISNFPSGVRFFFDKARFQVKLALFDSSGYGGNLAGYLSVGNALAEVVSRLETAYNRAIDAERLASQQRIQQAFEKWQLIFDDYFPGFG